MSPEFAPVVAGAVLLLVAGAGKVRRPAATRGALRSVGVRASAGVVRALGAVEIALGLLVVIVGGAVPTAALGIAYLGFTGFLILALRSGGAISSCGCLGRPDTPPTRTHAVVTAVVGVMAVVAAARGGVQPHRLAWTGSDVALVGFTALTAWLVYLAFAVLPHARLTRPKES